MSAANLAPRNKAKPPEKGVFPLDHFAECKPLVNEYLNCVNANDGDTQPCIHLSKAYLQCRMDRSLMARQDLRELGLEMDNSKNADSQQGQQGQNHDR